jgi:hypothetical protein
MKIQFSAIVFFLSIFTAFSQKQFEGTIIYDYSPDTRKANIEITVTFGKKGIKVKTRDKNGNYNEELLVLIDSGKVYNLIVDKKTYGVRKLKQKEISTYPGRKEILGYSTSAKNTNSSAISTLALMVMSQEAVFYEADSLFYKIPDRYAPNTEFAFIHDGKIILMIEMKLVSYFPARGDETEDEISEEPAKMVIEAKSVKWEPISDAELSIPPDFTRIVENNTADSTIAVDTIAMVDTLVQAPEKMPAKKAVSPNKKPTTPPKKINNQPGSSLRKPE